MYQLNHWTLLLLGDHLVLIYLTSSYYNQAAEAEAAREARAKVKRETLIVFLLFWLKPAGHRSRGRTKSIKISCRGEQSDVRDRGGSSTEIPPGPPITFIFSLNFKSLLSE